MKKFISFFAVFSMFFILSSTVFALHPACLGHSISVGSRCVGGSHNGAIGTGCGCCPHSFYSKREFNSITGYGFVTRCT